MVKSARDTWMQVQRTLRDWPGGRWFVYSGLAVGIFFAVQQVLAGSALYSAFIKGAVAATVTMVLAGFAQRLHAGDKLKSAQLPGGAGGEFEPAEAAQAARQSIETLAEHVTTQGEQMIEMQAGLDKRVADLEDAVFKGLKPRLTSERD